MIGFEVFAYFIEENMKARKTFYLQNIKIFLSDEFKI